MNNYHGEEPQKLIEDALKYVMQGISTNMDRLNRKASGNSQRKMKIVMDSEDHGYLAGPKYPFTVLERGRGKNRNANWAKRGQGSGGQGGLIDAIQKWIIDKGIPIHTNMTNGYNPNAFTNESRRMAGAIARSISKNGTKLYRSGQRDDIFTSNIQVATTELESKIYWWASTKIEKIFQR